MAKKRKSHIPICDPSECDNCIYIGDGTFICDKYNDNEGHPATIVVDGWNPAKDYGRCGKETQ